MIEVKKQSVDMVGSVSGNYETESNPKLQIPGRQSLARKDRPSPGQDSEKRARAVEILTTQD